MIITRSHMQRCAVIRRDNGEIIWEGVKIDDRFLMESGDGISILHLTNDEMKDYIRGRSYYAIVFKDENQMWCPYDQMTGE